MRRTQGRDQMSELHVRLPSMNSTWKWHSNKSTMAQTLAASNYGGPVTQSIPTAP